MVRYGNALPAAVVLILACCGCDAVWRLDVDVSMDVRDPELRKWLAGSRVEFWAISRPDSVPEWTVRRPGSLGEVERADEDPERPSTLSPEFDGPIVRCVKWSEESGVRTARFSNCLTIYGAIDSPAVCSPTLRIVPASGDDKVLFLGRNGENEAVWVVAEKVGGSSSKSSSKKPWRTLPDWDGSCYYRLTEQRYLTSAKFSADVDEKGGRVEFHVQVPHPDAKDKEP